MNTKTSIILTSFLLLGICSAQSYYTNPVLTPGTFSGTNIGSMADPGVFKDTDGTYYMYVTGTGYPAFSSKDLVNWKYEKKVFSGSGKKWSTTGFWAPEVFKFNNKYYLTYSAAVDGSSPKRIGLAVSNLPLGPYADLSDQPFFIQNETRGTIDSHFFIDEDNRIYLYYTCVLDNEFFPGTNKNRSEIWVVEVAQDLSTTIGTPQMLTYPEQAWEFNSSSNNYWNEGVQVFKHNNIYYLMFSANCYCNSDYGVGYATSYAPMGPYTKYSGNPILTAKGVAGVSGTGHNAVVMSPDGSEMFCIYHSHFDINNPGGTRMINIDRMGFDNHNGLYVSGPTLSAQPYPSNIPSSLPETKKATKTIAYNSVGHSLQLKGAQENQLLKCQVYNMQGQLLFAKRIIGENTIEVTDLTKGVYIVQFTGNNNELFHSKFIVTE